MKPRKNIHISCVECQVGHLCLTKNLAPASITLLDDKIQYAQIFQPNERLYLQGTKITYVYAIYSGLCKDYSTDENGNICVNEFYLSGDILGLEYLDKEVFQLDAVALKETIVCAIPISLLKNAEEIPKLKERFLEILCQQIDNHRYYANQTNVKCRIAAFLLNFIRRVKQRQDHDSNKDFDLTYEESIAIPISYIDISNKIGISNETFSRILKEFIADGLFKIQHNTICNIDIKRLQNILIA